MGIGSWRQDRRRAPWRALRRRGDPAERARQVPSTPASDRIDEAPAQRALRDPLTRLPNRSLLSDRLDQALARSGRVGSPVGLLFINLDGFGLVNDAFGKHVGNAVLSEVADRFAAVLRAGDTLGRFGGDEFVAICEGVDHASVLRVAERLEAALTRRFVLQGAAASLRASIGIVMATDGPATVDDLLSDAAAAMNRAKALGGGRYELYDHDLQARQNQRQNLRQALEGAALRNELALAYQPYVALGAEPVWGDPAGLPPWDVVVGVEALLRWQHPSNGWQPASDFVSVAEASGLIVPIGAWALHQACRQAACWQGIVPGGQTFTVFVNVSVEQLADRTLVDSLLESLAETGADPRSIGIEFAESVLRSNDEEAIATLEALSGHGIRLCVDDFGGGYSSVAELRRVPVEYVKIDVAHIRGSLDRALVSSVTGMAKELGIAVIAEGVETAAQLEAVRELGCRFAQGFHLALPTTPDSIEALLGAGRGVRDRGRD